MTIFRICLCLCTLILLTACQKQAKTETDTVLPVAPSTVSGGASTGLTTEQIQALEKQAETCRAGGGQWVRGEGVGSCVKSTTDGGKACKSSTTCEGFCLAEGKVCSSRKPLFGCHKLYENGQTPTLCVDQ